MKYVQYRFLSSLQREAITSIVTQQRHWSDGVRGKYYGEERIKIGYWPYGFINTGDIVVFRGTIFDDPKGTMIIGCFQTPIFYLIFNCVFLWLLRASIIIFIGQTILSGYGYFPTILNTDFDYPIAVLIILSIIFLCSFFLEWIIKARAKEGKEIILQLIKKELHATMQNH